jgi:glutaminyl-peptide cyclotransferase
MKIDRRLGLILIIVIVSALVESTNSPRAFNAQRAYQNIATQLEFGPRVPGSAAHAAQLDWMEQVLLSNDWQVERQQGQIGGHEVTNLFAKRGTSENVLLLGAHYDSRIFADNDPLPENQNKPVAGANDGASGVAVLLELAQVLPPMNDLEIWIVFFDAEDNGNIDGWNWILGSRYFAENMKVFPDQVVIVDMVGDADLSLPLEGNSDQELAMQIWDSASDLGHGQIFIPEIVHYILDDHLPFKELGIPVVAIIDIEYPYWHTSEDTLQHVSAQSLEIVGSTLLDWILNSH